MELTIPPYDINAAPATQPGFFFTAVLSGCTIIFAGTADNPTIYHCGTAGVTGGGVPTQGDSNDFFLEMLRRCRTRLGLGNLNAALGQAPRRVLKTDYMVTGDPMHQVGIAAALTPILTAQQTYFGQRNHRLATLEPWGSVFGVRRPNNNWVFYLQVNGTYVYRRIMTETVWDTHWVRGLVPVPTRVPRDITDQEVPSCDARPLFIQEVFPNVGLQEDGVRGTGINLG